MLLPPTNNLTKPAHSVFWPCVHLPTLANEQQDLIRVTGPKFTKLLSDVEKSQSTLAQQSALQSV